MVYVSAFDDSALLQRSCIQSYNAERLPYPLGDLTIYFRYSKVLDLAVAPERAKGGLAELRIDLCAAHAAGHDILLSTVDAQGII